MLGIDSIHYSSLFYRFHENHTAVRLLWADHCFPHCTFKFKPLMFAAGLMLQCTPFHILQFYFEKYTLFVVKNVVGTKINLPTQDFDLN